jgi:hypothetical protein
MMCPRQLALLIAVFLGQPGLSSAEGQDASPDAKATSPVAARGIRPGDIQKVFVLKSAHVDDMAAVLSVFPAEIRVSRSLHVLSVAAAPAVVAAIEETIKRLDVAAPPSRSVEVTGYILECSSKAGEAGAVPSELQDVLTQLKRTFNYTSCGLMQTLFTRGADRANFMTTAGAQPAYVMEGRIEVDAGQGTSIVRFRLLTLRVVGGSVNFTGGPELRDGQRVVLGKLASAPGADSILVLSAKLVD